MNVLTRSARSTSPKQNSLIFCFLFCFEFFGISSALQCRFSQEWRGRYFQSGLGDIVIRESAMTTKGHCMEQSRDYFLFENKEQNCFSCLLLLRQHKNLIQYKESFCTSQNILKVVCAQIRVETPLYTLVREPSLPVRCPFQDAYRFKYNDLLHGFCSESVSLAEPCASPSKYRLKFRHCERTALYNDKELEFECLASWKDGSETYLYSRLSGTESTAKDDRYRCFKYHQYGNEVSLAMSADATCRGLRTATDGPFLLEFTEDNSGWPPPSCHFPDWLKGVTWRDLIGRFRYNVDEHGQRLFVSVRNSSRDHVSSQFRCRHITTNERHLANDNDDDDEYIVNTFATNNCASVYQCLKLKKLANRVVEIHIGMSRNNESHIGYCHTDSYQDFRILTAEGSSSSGVSSAIACPRPGMHHTAPADGCIYRLNVGCRSESTIEIDHSCSSGRPGVLLECLSNWSDAHRSYVIVKQRQSDLLNCYSFREERGVTVFGVDPLCNRNVSLIGGQHIHTYTSLRHENCRRELRTTTKFPTALHKSPLATMATINNDRPLSSADDHRKDISILHELSSSTGFDDDDEEEEDFDESSGRQHSEAAAGRFEETREVLRDLGKSHLLEEQNGLESPWVTSHLNRPLLATINASDNKDNFRRNPVDEPNKSGPKQEQKIETHVRKDLTSTKSHSTNFRSKSHKCRSSAISAAAIVILSILKMLLRFA